MVFTVMYFVLHVYIPGLPISRNGPDRTQTLIHGTDRNGVERMREAAGLLRLLSQPWLAQRESPVESLTT